MIEINLLPGTGKKSKTKTAPRVGPNPGVGSTGASFDRSTGLIASSWIAGVLLLGWMIMGGRARLASLESEVGAAVLDSVRLAEIIKSTERLNERMRIVISKMNVVQEVDASRYIWPHLLDEVARAVPEHTWLVRITHVPGDSTVKYPRFALEGRTGNNFALTRYLQQLEASPFIRQVRLKESQLVREHEKLVYSFQLDADFEPPPPDAIQTEPLFAANLDENGAPASAQPNRAAPRTQGPK